MNVVANFPVALRALRVNALRSGLTMLGIIIGVAAVITMVAVGSGAQERVAKQIQSLGSNLIIIFNASSRQGGVRLGAGTVASLTVDDANALQNQIGEVAFTAPFVRGVAQVVAGNLNWSTGVVGVTPSFFPAREWDVQSGRTFSEEEARSGAKIALLGETVVKNVFVDVDPVGETVRIKNVPFTVIGVMARKGQNSFGQDQDDVVVVPLTTAKQRIVGQSSRTRPDAVQQIMIKVREGAPMKQAEEQIVALLRQRHNIQPGAEDDFNVRNLSELMETREAAQRILSILLAAVASISLIVGGIGIMNIMLVSVTERTREIGLRMAVGARRRDILMQFLVEAITLSVIGGLIGIVLGVGAAAAIARLANWPTLVEPLSLVIAVGFSAAVGVFFGFYPARKAAQLDPILALRYE
ncbi:MAG: FtsX-like permease family protein [Alphaproteobacteria bacterium]|nr:FtsX-like permease family protein [Alphaproteobacteria bacterium]